METVNNKKRSGHYCSYKECGTRYYNKEPGTRFFRFPKDQNMCEEWLRCCGRDDLISEGAIGDLYNKRRVCSLHFENNMFVGPSKNRLLQLATPRAYTMQRSDSEINAINKILVDPHQSTSIGTHKRSLEDSVKEAEAQHITKKIKLLQDVTVFPALSSLPSLQIPNEVILLENAISPLSSPVGTQTPASLTLKSPRKIKLENKIKELKDENKKLRKEIEISHMKKKQEPTLDNFNKLCDKFLNPELANFVKWQTNNLNRSSHGKRYSDDFKKFALSLYFTGPKCYRQLNKTFNLPSKRVLERFVEKVNMSVGLNEDLFKLLKIKVDLMDKQDRMCTLCIDEISIKCNLFYNFGRDEIIGFEDNLKHNGDTPSLQPANYALVVMVRGLKNNWKQSIAYAFSSTGFCGADLKNILNDIILKLTEIGLNTVALISDMGANNIELSEILEVTPEHPQFTLGKRKIFFFFDPPHLIKAVRNNLLTNVFVFDNKKTSWEYIKQFYEMDRRLKNRLAPKLTNSHVNPTNFEKMRVKYATQILSATVAAALETYINLKSLPEEAIDTVKVISMFDKLFDIFNSSTFETKKQFNRPFEGQEEYVKFLNKMLVFLKKLKIIGNSGKNRGKNITSYMKFIRGWQISINSLLKFWEYTKSENFSFILTRRLNQDALENYFGSVRQQSGNCVNPTPIQFARAFKKLFIIKYLHTEDMNCAADFDTVLSHLPSLASENISGSSDITSIPSFRLNDCDYHQKSLPEQNAFKYVAGYLINKCLNVHKCEICKNFSRDNDELDSSNQFIHFKAYNTKYSLFGGLKTPQESFYNYLFVVEKMFYENIQKHLTKPGVGNQMYNIIKLVNAFNHPCENFPMDYLIRLYVRMRIFYLLKYSNRTFKTTSKKNRKLCILLNL